MELLDQAVNYIEETEHLKKSIRIAIVGRLKFRRGFLHAIALESSLARQQHTAIWSSCLALLSELTKSQEYGTPVPTCFSAKIQRRLASTVPPRPLISTSITDAHDYVKRLLEDGIAAGYVLDCRTGSQITVNNCPSVPIIRMLSLYRTLRLYSNLGNRSHRPTYAAY